MTDKEWNELRLDILYGAPKFMDYGVKIIPPTPEEIKEQIAREKKWKREERIEDCWDAFKFSLGVGLFVTIVMAVPAIIFGIISLL